MKNNTKYKVISGLFFLGIVILSLGYFINRYVDNWTNEILLKNRDITRLAAQKLRISSLEILTDKILLKMVTKENPKHDDLLKIDSVLCSHTSKLFFSIRGMEGGFYFTAIKDFAGYSFPTSPPPVPAFGPPPRSYNIILNQVKKAIIEDKNILEVHKFDPAVFPLATEPIKINGKIVGAVWARVHIERDLPSIRLKEIFKFATYILIVALIVATIIYSIQRVRINEIKRGLELLKTDPDFRFKNRNNMFGYIGQSINDLVITLVKEHNQRQELERELHQQDKMASLGKLIAGVAHEVKTPLAIIKTRVQMWQQELKSDQNNFNFKMLTNESFSLVVREIDRLSKLIKKLLTFSKPNNLVKTYADVNQILNDTISVIMTDLPSSVKIAFSPDTGLPKILCDPASLNQMFLNVITNSRDAVLPAGEIIISTSFTDDKKSVLVKIEDSGSGIADEIKEKIFDPFFTTKEHGVGLGLSIVYEIVRIHEGTITYKNSENFSILCEIILPIKKNKN